jgi:acetyl esterase/lipase
MTGMPPAYTFVGDGEPFYCETLEYAEKLRRAGAEAEADVFHTDVHGFDLLLPMSKSAKLAREAFNRHFAYAKEHWFAEQP